MSTPTLRFGTGGVPLSTKAARDPITGDKLDMRQSGVLRLAEMGLDHMEVEFVHGINIKEENARALNKLAHKYTISLTVHGPYYINLASDEPATYHASIDRIRKTIVAASWIGAPSITFHAAFYQKRTPEETTTLVRQRLLDTLASDKLIRQAGGMLPLISIETTGKPSQWGSLDEILDLTADLNNELGRFQFSACIDFAHLHARSNGKCNSKADFHDILTKTEAKLGKEALQHLHMHISGINYTNKGERNHLNLDVSDLKYQELLAMLKKHHVAGWAVCESPNLEADALMMKTYYEGT